MTFSLVYFVHLNCQCVLSLFQYVVLLLEQIVEEAGGVVTCMDGGKFTVFDRSVLASNDLVHDQLMEKIGPATEELKKKGIDFSLWFMPENYATDF